MKKMSDRTLGMLVIFLVLTILGSIFVVSWLARPTKEKFKACEAHCAEMDAPVWHYGHYGCECGGPTN